MKMVKTLKDDETKMNAGVEVGRRTVVGWFWRLVGLIGLLELGWITGSILRSSRGSSAATGRKIVDAGMVVDFNPGTVTPVVTGQFHLARFSDGSFLALSKSCTHLGCSLFWDEEKNIFICPCHGSTFDIQGTVLTPPALRPLDYYPVLIENGLVRVDVSKPLRREEFLDMQTSRVEYG